MPKKSKLSTMEVTCKKRGREETSKRVFVRPDSTDENVMREVIETKTYRRASIGFDVEPGERWLDLGGNIGAFAVYCELSGASCISYEPDPECFQILQKNSQFDCVNAAVSSLPQKRVNFFSSSRKNNFYRGTLLKQTRMMKPEDDVDNIYCRDIVGSFDGIKMDIEGSEFGLIDDWMLPRCQKLCFEYHTSRDKSMANLKRRVEILRSRFHFVAYAPELDKIMALGGQRKSFYDQNIWCMDPIRKAKKKARSK